MKELFGFWKRKVIEPKIEENDNFKDIYTWHGELSNGFRYRIKPLTISQIQKFYNYVIPCFQRIMMSAVGDAMEITPEATISDIPVIDIRTIFNASSKKKEELGGLHDYSLADFFTSVQFLDIEKIDGNHFSISENWTNFGNKFRDLEDLGIINYEDINQVAEDVIRVTCMGNDISLNEFRNQYRAFCKNLEGYRFSGSQEEEFRYNVVNIEGKVENWKIKVQRLTNKTNEIDMFRERIFSYNQPGYVNVFALLDKENEDLFEKFLSKIQIKKSEDAEWATLTKAEVDKIFFGKILMLISVFEIAHEAMTSKKTVREIKKK